MVTRIFHFANGIVALGFLLFMTTGAIGLVYTVIIAPSAGDNATEDHQYHTRIHIP